MLWQKIPGYGRVQTTALGLPRRVEFLMVSQPVPGQYGWPCRCPRWHGVCMPFDGPDPLAAGVPLDTNLPHIARVCDYWLGGKDNFAADRELAEKFMLVRSWPR